MIPRAVYQMLLWFHPPSFRRRFAAEMLWIFDEAATRQRSWGLLADGFVSLLRQWLLRSGAVWKLPLIVIGGLLAPLLGLGALPVVRFASTSVHIHSLQSLMIFAALCSVLVIGLTLFSVSWFRFVQKRRA